MSVPAGAQQFTIARDVNCGVGGSRARIANFGTTSAPEPATVARMGTGLVALVGIARRRRTA